MSLDNLAPGQLESSAPCRACGTLVVWCTSAKTFESVCVEAIPSKSGAVSVWSAAGKLFAGPVKSGVAAGMRAAGVPVYLRHAFVCESTRRAEAGR